jgi:hypothetical protein
MFRVPRYFLTRHSPYFADELKEYTNGILHLEGVAPEAIANLFHVLDP